MQATSISSSAADLLTNPAASEGGGTSDSLPDYVYPLDSYVQSGAIPKGYLWYALDLSKDLYGVLSNPTANMTEEAEAALSACAAYNSDYDGGACCTVTSYGALVDGCTVVRVVQGVSVAVGLHNWTIKLPAGVKALSLSNQNVTGGLPVSFGNATTSLEKLVFRSNNFTGALPEEWGALTSINVIDLRWNPLLMLGDMPSPAWAMLSWGELSDLGGNVWSRLEMLLVETEKVPAAVFTQGWSALDSDTLIPVNGSGAGSPFSALPEGDVTEVPEGHSLRPYNLAYNLSVLSSMDRASDTYAAAGSCQLAKEYLGLEEGACCHIWSFEAAVDGCMVISVWPGVEVDGLHDWTPKLPAGVKLLSVGGLGLTGILPGSFGNATTSLQLLKISSNNFTRVVPQEWEALSSIKVIDVRWNPLLSLDTMASPAWLMAPWEELSDLKGNVWSRLEMLLVEPYKVPAGAFSLGWLALDNETLIPVNGSGAGSPFSTALPGWNVTEVPEGHRLRPFDLAYNISVLASMDRASSEYAVARYCQSAKTVSDVQEGACCSITSYEANVDGCTVVFLWSGIEASDGLHDWTLKLPAGVKVLDATDLRLTGSLPVSFGYATASLEQLRFGGNNFTGTLPISWSELRALRLVMVSNNHLTGTLPAAWSALSSLEGLWLSKGGTYPGRNAFIGTLPSEWSELSNLLQFSCANGACAVVNGYIPGTWARLCKLQYFSLYEPANSTSQLTGRLPWKWMYELFNEWRNEDIECFPNVVDIPSNIEFPRYVCLARGNPKITAAEFIGKSYRRNDGEWALIMNSTGIAPEAEAAGLASEFAKQGFELLYGTHSFDQKHSACTSTNRFTLIPVVYSVFGFVMLCALVALLVPTSVLSCLVPAGGSTGGLRSLITKCYNSFLIVWIVKHIGVILSVFKVGSVLADVGTDVYAAYLVGQTSFVWGYITMLLLPNVVGAFVLHLNQPCVAKEQQQQPCSAATSMAQTPACYPLYQWLYKKGGVGLLLFAGIFLVPYWLLWEIPMLISAALGHALGHVWQRFKGSWFTVPWLNLGNFLALLSLVMACTESPFVAVLFTYHYAQGMSYSFPVFITDWEFVLTVGFALLHIAWESWSVVLSIKAGRFKKSIKRMFLGVLNCGTEAEVQPKGVASGASGGHADAELELSDGRMRSKNVGVGGSGSKEAQADQQGPASWTQERHLQRAYAFRGM